MSQPTASGAERPGRPSGRPAPGAPTRTDDRSGERSGPLGGRFRLPGWLPRGHALSDAEWRRRHRWVCVVLLVHVLAVPAYALAWGDAPLDALGFGAALAVFLVAAQFDDVRRFLADDPGLPAFAPRWMRSCAAALGLVVASGEIVQISDGWTEAHFHFFVMVPVVALYEAWAPFTVAAGYVLFQHGIVGTLFPRIVFHTSAAHEHPWTFALVHAGLFACACVGSLTMWRLAETSRIRQDRLLAQMQHRALHDLLTGLPNRAALRAVLEDELGPGGRPGEEDVAVLMIDLDRFKEVNDTLGHACGDDLLRQVAARLASAIRDGDLLARLGGDEFAVVLPGGSVREARVVAERLRRSLSGDLVVSGVAVDVDASIGIANRSTARALRRSGTASDTDPAPGTGDPGIHDPGIDDPGIDEEIETLLRQADIAMYSAKERGTGIAVYDPSGDGHSSQRLSTLADLRGALGGEPDAGELFLHYLPKVELGTGAVCGVEALVRWRHPRRGMLPPAAFVPVAEGTALAEPLTDLVLTLALAQVARWTAAGHRTQVSVNVPARCLRPGFVDTVLGHLVAAGVPSHQLRLEVTEATLLSDPQTVTEVLVRLRQAGVQISVDDFGTGFSSLSTLRTLPVDELKIDRSFVLGLASQDPVAREADAALIASVVRIAQGLSLRVVAEGIENPDLHRAAVAAGCDLAQGFHYSRPVTADEVSALFERSTAGDGFVVGTAPDLGRAAPNPLAPNPLAANPLAPADSDPLQNTGSITST